MSERGLYRKGFDLDSEDKYVINRNKKIRESKKKSDHKHIYTKIIIECEEKESYFGSRQVAWVADICLQCGRVQNLTCAEILKHDDYFNRDLLILTFDPDEVEKAYPDLPVYTAVRGKHWNNFTDIKLKENNIGDQK